MFVRIALAAALVSASTVVIACAPDSPQTPDRSESEVRSAPKGKDAGASNKGGDDSETVGSEPRRAADGGAGGKGEATPAPPADPTCVASCTASLKAKCDGEDDFCEVVCSKMTAGHLACMIAASSCSKDAWNRCADENPSGNGGKK